MNSYDVRIHSLLTNKNAKGNSYTVRWKVAGRPFRDTFATKAAAESFRSKLLVAQREGVAFDTEIGLPEPMARAERKEVKPTWLAHAMAFVDMKWPHASGKHRKGIAETLVTVTPLLLSTDQVPFTDKAIRAALYHLFNAAKRNADPAPEEMVDVIAWLEAHAVTLDQVAEPVRLRKRFGRAETAA